MTCVHSDLFVRIGLNYPQWLPYENSADCNRSTDLPSRTPSKGFIIQGHTSHRDFNIYLGYNLSFYLKCRLKLNAFGQGWGVDIGK